MIKRLIKCLVIITIVPTFVGLVILFPILYILFNINPVSNYFHWLVDYLNS